MPRIIKNGAIVEDQWQPLNPDNDGPASSQQILSLAQWLALDDKSGHAVQLEPGETPDPLFEHLAEIPLVAVHFPAFMDGRGFSYARELRERGYCGELRACGLFLRDQMTYLHRVGFDAFQMADESELGEALASLEDFSEHYQAAIDEPLPLFRRRG
jgi:uncharacterized protein (DUF934 family)